jgi:acetyltransferase
MRIIGSNSLGLLNPLKDMNAALGAAVGLPAVQRSSEWSPHENIGFSVFISVGSTLDVGGDLIDYPGNDPHTRTLMQENCAVMSCSASLRALLTTIGATFRPLAARVS